MRHFKLIIVTMAVFMGFNTMQGQNIQSKMADLAASFKELNAYPILTISGDGSILLSTKEKMVKPTYLLNPSIGQELTTMDQRLRGLAMLLCDAQIAKLYEMPVKEYKEAIARLAIGLDFSDIPDPFDVNTINAKLDYRDAVRYWTYSAAFCVESTYILTQNIELFMRCFDDKSAAQVSKRFNIVEDAIESLLPSHPEMRPLHQILQPLYILNAVNVIQLTKQLNAIKEQVDNIRNTMLD